MTSRLAADGYDVIGIDLSAEMLEAARDKCPDSVLLLQQDMCELDLYGTARAFVCVCDGMNYLTELEMLRQTFEKVFLFLDQDGVFLFDMKTAYEIRLSLVGSEMCIRDSTNALAVPYKSNSHISCCNSSTLSGHLSLAASNISAERSMPITS